MNVHSSVIFDSLVLMLFYQKIMVKWTLRLQGFGEHFFFLRERLKKQQRKYGSEWLIQVLSGSFPILLLWLGDAQHPPQQIPDSPFQLRPLNPYCTGGFCTLPSTILHQWGFKVNKLMNFTRSGIGTSQICHSWCSFGQHEEGKEHLYLMSSCCSCF